MKRIRKTAAVIGMAAVMALSAVIPAFAGTWKNVGGYWYFSDPEDNGSEEYLTGWQWIDGYCYYLNPDAGGAMAVLTVTPDGFMVDAEGHWINEFGVPYYLEGFGFSTAAGPSTVGMAYTDPALTGPAFADVPEEVRYPGDDVIVSGDSRGSSSPSYGSFYGGISVQTIIDIRNAIRAAESVEENVEETEERVERAIERSEGSGRNSGSSDEKSEAAEEKSEENEEKSSETKESGKSTEESGNTDESPEKTEKIEEKSTDTEKGTGSEKETKSEEKNTEDKDSSSKEDNGDD